MRLPATCSADVFSMYSGTLSNLSSKPSSKITMEQNTASFIVRAAFQRATWGRPMTSLKVYEIRFDAPAPELVGYVPSESRGCGCYCWAVLS